MITQVKEFISDFDKKHGPFKKILDVGCRNVNGSVKEQIKSEYDEFIGVDIEKDKSVDVVLDGRLLHTKWKRPRFDLVTCTETLEHVARYWEVIESMKKVLKSGGWLLVTTPGPAHPFHGWPSDYNRFFKPLYEEYIFKGFKDVVVVEKFWSNCADQTRPDAVMGYGRKP